MRRACEIGKKNKLDPILRRYILSFAAAFGVSCLIGGFYLGFDIISHEPAMAAPFMENALLNIFIAISCGAAGMIFGAFVGSTLYRIKERKDRKKSA